MPNQQFNYKLPFDQINFREQPNLYRIGKGEQGVLLLEPYKSELLPHWRFKNPAIAKASAQKLLCFFKEYKKNNDFVGMDMARKFLQMGYTRARRYANHESGKKYDGPVPDDKKGESGAHGRAILPKVEDAVKAESAAIFYTAWQRVKNDKTYLKLALQHRQLYEQ